MDSRIGLDYIVENRDYIAKLGSALDTQNATVKKQVFELLSALCAYSPDGYARAIETLEFYKNLKKERYRFKIVINELEQSTAAATPPVDYLATLLAFINCVIISEPKLQERIRIRNEFIAVFDFIDLIDVPADPLTAPLIATALDHMPYATHGKCPDGVG
ncbi:hypothetical protein AWZ03_000830 [Drosophila navojoa]|uniref:GBD/FH3 domain-containing protein n=1 Tax=Drosophila navojoa TaxID=7232 RepID=A0A484BUV2_DRONA|nr:hypothetical protein AWZ03_000830 [Drosophila navojoa]